MQQKDLLPKTNYKRRTFGALLCLAPIELGIASLIWGLLHSYAAPLFLMAISIGLMTLGVLAAAFNFYLSWIRPLLLMHKPDYHFVSGIPLLGGLLVVAGMLLGFGSVVLVTAGMAALLLDTGSTVWFLIAIWQDTSMWDE